MSIEGFSKKPESVKRAITDGDQEYLSAAGKKGAEKTNEQRRFHTDMEAERSDRLREIRENEEKVRLESANLHVLDEEGNDPNLDLDK